MAHNGTNNGDLGGLTPLQEAVALALARGRSIRRAAEDCQAGERTVKTWLNPDQVETRSFASNSGSSSNLGQRRSTSATGSRLMRATKASQASIKAGTLAWQ